MGDLLCGRRASPVEYKAMADKQLCAVVGHGGGGAHWRLFAAVIGLLALAPLIVAFLLTPTAADGGTHTQLGLPECGFRLYHGYPCPTCGMTTAFALAVRGRLIAAFLVQPAGLLLAGLCLAAGIIALRAAGLGRKPYFLYRVNWPKAAWLFLGIIMASWIYNCLRVYRA